MKSIGFADIISTAMAPIDSGFRIPKQHKEVYITNGIPKVLVDESIVLSSMYPSTGLYAHVPEKAYEFDFYNEYEGFIEANHLKAIPIDDYANVAHGSYVVDMDTMTVYHYVSHEVGVLKTFEVNYKTHTLETRVRH